MEKPPNPFTRAFVSSALHWVATFLLLLVATRDGGVAGFAAAAACVGLVAWGVWNLVKAAR